MTEGMQNRRFLYMIAFVIIILTVGSILLWQPNSLTQPSKTSTSELLKTSTKQLSNTTFDSKRAYQDVLEQVELGPRITGTEGNLKCAEYIAGQLRQAGWSVEFQNFTYRGTQVRNVIGRTNVGKGSIIILGAHYDTRRWADQDPAHPHDPVPGANDGASGVAVLLELARAINVDKVHHEIWMAFFDAEDDGQIDGWDWIVGSTYMANNLSAQPQAMILVDMVGDTEQNFYFDGNSDPSLSQKVWAIAGQLGYGDYFIPQVKYSMTDDHIPFVQRGIPSVDIIDFDYPYWHTIADTADKVSPVSLERVGQALQVFLETMNE
jgi:glutaminyl-peptide cyclotransferase